MLYTNITISPLPTSAPTDIQHLFTSLPGPDSGDFEQHCIHMLHSNVYFVIQITYTQKRLCYNKLFFRVLARNQALVPRDRI